MISEDQVAVAGGGEVPAGAGSVVPEAARRPLRELTGDRLWTRCWSGRGTPRAGCG